MVFLTIDNIEGIYLKLLGAFQQGVWGSDWALAGWGLRVLGPLYQLCLCGVCFGVCTVCDCALVLYKVLSVAAFSRDRQLLWCVFDLFLHGGTLYPEIYALIMYQQHLNTIVCCCAAAVRVRCFLVLCILFPSFPVIHLKRKS